MTRLHLAYAVALLIPALAGTPAARARIAQSDAVRPDVEAFLRAAPLGDPVQLSSSLPAGFPSELLPVGGAVAVVSSSATVTTTVLTVPRPFNLIAYFDDLSRAGWTGDFGAAGGFVALPAEVMRSPNAVLCKGAQTASVFAKTDADGRPLLRLSARSGAGSPCGRTPSERPTSNLALPLLQMPADAAKDGGGASLSANSYVSRSTFSSTTSLPAVHKAIVDQLQAFGWTIDGAPELQSSFSIARLMTTRRSGGRVERVDGVFMLTRTDPASIDAMFRVVTPYVVRTAPILPSSTLGAGGRGAGPVPSLTDAERLFERRVDRRSDPASTLPVGFPAEAWPADGAIFSTSRAGDAIGVAGTLPTGVPVDVGRVEVTLERAGWTIQKMPVGFVRAGVTLHFVSACRAGDELRFSSRIASGGRRWFGVVFEPGACAGSSRKSARGSATGARNCVEQIRVQLPVPILDIPEDLEALDTSGGGGGGGRRAGGCQLEYYAHLVGLTLVPPERVLTAFANAFVAAGMRVQPVGAPLHAQLFTMTARHGQAFRGLLVLTPLGGDAVDVFARVFSVGQP